MKILVSVGKVIITLIKAQSFKKVEFGLRWHAHGDKKIEVWNMGWHTSVEGGEYLNGVGGKDPCLQIIIMA